MLECCLNTVRERIMVINEPLDLYDTVKYWYNLTERVSSVKIRILQSWTPDSLDFCEDP